MLRKFIIGSISIAPLIYLISGYAMDYIPLGPVRNVVWYGSTYLIYVLFSGVIYACMLPAFHKRWTIAERTLCLATLIFFMVETIQTIITSSMGLDFENSYAALVMWIIVLILAGLVYKKETS